MLRDNTRIVKQRSNKAGWIIISIENGCWHGLTMKQQYFRLICGKRTGSSEYSNSGGGNHAHRCMAGTEQLDVFAAVVYRQFSPAVDCSGRGILSQTLRTRRFGCKEYTDWTEFTPGSTYYEEVLMREQTLSGGHSASFCSLTITIAKESVTQLCWLRDWEQKGKPYSRTNISIG